MCTRIFFGLISISTILHGTVTFDQVRAITCEVGLLPRTHGSALFTRGETQALVTTTLGTSDDMQRLEAFEGDTLLRSRTWDCRVARDGV